VPIVRVNDDAAEAERVLAVIELSIVSDAHTLVDGLQAWVDEHTKPQSAVWWQTINGLLANSLGDADIIIFDFRFTDVYDSTVNVRRISQVGRQIIIISTWPEPEFIAAVLAVSTGRYERNHQDMRQLAPSVHSVGASEVTGSRRPQLSPRERDVLAAYTSGMTLDAVARHFGISPGTVKTYLGRVKVKYHEAGRPAYTKLDLAKRFREDSHGPSGPTH
jgi:two-component system, NarL family, nitrate/nitrite response regulator NarL